MHEKLRVQPSKVLLKTALYCMLLAILCRMLYRISDNNAIRIAGYGFQMFTLVCYVCHEMVYIRRKTINFLILLGMLIVYQCAVAIFTNSFYWPLALLDILIWPLSIIVYESFSKRHDIEKMMHTCIVWFYAAMCVASVPLLAIHLAGRGLMGAIIFPTYFCTTTLPLVILFARRQSVKNICMLVAIVISIASTKRAGTLALVFGIFAMLVANAQIQGTLKKKWKKYLQLFILICIMIISVLILENAGKLRIWTRFATLSSDGGNGRDIIWKTVMDAYNTSSLSQQLFGHGFQSVYYVLKPGGFFRFAHNSYIEYLYDYGLIGLGLLIVFVAFLCVSAYKMLRRKSRFAPVMCFMLVLTLFLSSFSYFFEESGIIMPIAVAYGTVLGLEKKEKKEHEVQHNRTRV